MNYLTISDRDKAIPYGPADREGGERNYGFRPLKGRLAEVAEVPEVASDSHLRALLLALNDEATGTFTIGCLSGAVADAKGYRRTGYLEYALNDQVAVSDAQCYFPAFFHFDRLWKRQAVELRAQLNWELQPAMFLTTGAAGFTCSVTVNTDFFSSQEEADYCWGQCLGLLGQLLTSIRAQSFGERIY
jgi:hypothetical protein